MSPDQTATGLWVPAGIYTRVSTNKQLGRRVESCESQEAICRDFIQSQAATKGWAVVATFTDPAYSGATMKRPGMDALKRAVAAGEIKLVVIFKLERVLRSTDEWAPFRAFLAQHRCELVSALEDISEKTALGRLKNNLLVSVSEYDRLNIAEKVRAKMGEQAKRGLWNGGSVPYGYAYDKNSQTLSVHPEEAPIVRRIYADAAKLISLTDLANALNAEGFRTKPRFFRRRDGSREAVGRRQFRSDGLRLLLTNPMYRGVVRFEGKEYAGQHPALVDVDLWERANAAVRETRPQPEVRIGQNVHQYLLKGICRCGHCGRAMIPITCGISNNAGKRYRYYNCGSLMRNREAECPVGRLPADSVDAAAVAFLTEVSKHSSLVTGVFETTRNRAKGDRNAIADQLNELDDRSGKIRAELSRCVDVVARGGVEALGPELRERVETLRGERDQLLIERERKRQELAACDATSFDEKKVRDSLARLGDILPNLSPAERVELVTLFLERVEFREAPKSKLGVASGNCDSQRVLAIRFRMHLAKLVEGIQGAASPGTQMHRYKLPMRGVNFEASIDFTNANRGEVVIVAPFHHIVRVSHRTRTVPPSLRQSVEPPRHLIVRAQEWRRMLETGHVANRVALAKRFGLTPGAVTRIMKMVKLLPEIQNFLSALTSKQAIRHFGMKKVGAFAELSPEAQRAAFERLRKAFAQPTPELLAGAPLNDAPRVSPAFENMTDAELIVALLRKRGPTAPREIAAEMNMNRLTLYRRLNTLVSNGVIQVAGHTKATRYSAIGI